MAQNPSQGNFEQEQGTPETRRKGGCVRYGCLSCGVLLLIVVVLAGWAAVVQTQLLEKMGLKAIAEDSQLSAMIDYAAAQALKDELVRSGFSQSGLQVAVLPMKEQG